MSCFFPFSGMFFPLALLVSAPALSAGAMDTETEYFGSSQTYWSHQFRNEEADLDQLAESLRGALKYSNGQKSGFEAAYVLQLSNIGTAGDSEGAGRNTYRLTGLSRPAKLVRTNDGTEHKIGRELDRLLFFASIGPVDVVVGRQIISFGPGKFANPTDIFVPWRHDLIFRTDRPGVDGVRIKVSAGGFSYIEGGVVLGEHADDNKSAAFLHASTYLLKADVGLVAKRFLGNNLLGLNVQRAIVDAGFWFEGSHISFDQHRISGNETLKMNRIVSGVDYSFADIYIAVEGIYNDAGKSDPADYTAAYYDQRFLDAAVFLAGKGYAGLIMSYSLQGLTNVHFQGLANLQDHSQLLIPSLVYSLSDNSELTCGINLGLGKSRDSAGAFHSEFGSYPTNTFLNLGVYF